MKKGKQDISKILLRGTLLTGVLVAFIAMSTSSVQLSGYVCQHDDVEQQSTDNEPSEDREAIKAFEAIPGSAQVSLEHEFLLIDILPDLEEEDEEFSSYDHQESAGSKILRILFRRIISPNAP